MYGRSADGPDQSGPVPGPPVRTSVIADQTGPYPLGWSGWSGWSDGPVAGQYAGKARGPLAACKLLFMLSLRYQGVIERKFTLNDAADLGSLVSTV